MASTESRPPRPVDRAVEILSLLVAMETPSGTPNRPLIDWIGDHLRAFGAEVTVIDGAPGRANLFATLGRRGAGGLVLSGHTDVVPPGDGWRTDPYKLTPLDDRLVGRGSADMKGFIACVLATIEALDPATLAHPLHLALSYDEEVGCVGVRSLLEQLGGPLLLHEAQPALVVIGEPTMMRPRHAHLGKAAFRVTLRGRAGHSSLAPFLPSAIGAAVEVATAVQTVGAAHADRARRDHTGEASADVTVNIGTIHGGSALNVLAEECELTFEIRHSVAFDPDRLLTPVWSCVDRQRSKLAAVGGDVEVVELSRYPALDTPRQQHWMQVVERLADRGPMTSLGFGTEGGLFSAAIDAPVVVCGPGDIAVAHRPDEWVAVEQLEACSGFLNQLIEAVCAHPVN